MKRLTIALLVLVTLFSFVSCKDEPEPPKEYTVTFDVQGHGTAPEVQKIIEGQKAAKPENPSETGFTFVGWYKEASCTNAWNFDTDTVGANITLYAKWIRIFTVTFDMNGYGEDVTAQTVVDGQKATKPEDPTSTDHGFVGWYTSNDVLYDFNTAVSADLTLKAKWAEKKSVTLNKNGALFNGNAKVFVGAKTLVDINAVKIKDFSSNEGYYTTADKTAKVANADGSLIPNVEGYTNGEGRWIRTETSTILYANPCWIVTIADPCNYYSTTPEPILVPYGEKIDPQSVPAFPSYPAGDDYEYIWGDLSGMFTGYFDFEQDITETETITICKNYTGDIIQSWRLEVVVL